LGFLRHLPLSLLLLLLLLVLLPFPLLLLLLLLLLEADLPDMLLSFLLILGFLLLSFSFF
jgi:hypothetical protein